MRFVNYGQTNEAGEDTALDFNSLFVNRTFAGEGIQLTLDHLRTTTDIPDCGPTPSPAWRRPARRRPSPPICRLRPRRLRGV